jgi:hypothetical protein
VGLILNFLFYGICSVLDSTKSSRHRLSTPRELNNFVYRQYRERTVVQVSERLKFNQIRFQVQDVNRGWCINQPHWKDERLVSFIKDLVVVGGHY